MKESLLPNLVVATVLTVYGIETQRSFCNRIHTVVLQQYLPFTVLKHNDLTNTALDLIVATVLTVYGIETCLQQLH